MEEIHVKLDKILNQLNRALAVLRKVQIEDFKFELNVVDVYEIYLKNLDKFGGFAGVDAKDKWEKNSHKPEFIRLLNTL